MTGLKTINPQRPFAHWDAADTQNRMRENGWYETYQEFPEAAEMKVNPIGQFTNDHGRAGVLAYNLIEEEVVKELLPAIKAWLTNPSKENLVEVLDGAVDSIYVIMQLCHTLDLPLQRAFAVVHTNNLHKIQLDENGQLRKREDGKLLKPENHPKPNLWEVLDVHSQEREREMRTMGSENWRSESKQLTIKELHVAAGITSDVRGADQQLPGSYLADAEVQKMQRSAADMLIILGYTWDGIGWKAPERKVPMV